MLTCIAIIGKLRFPNRLSDVNCLKTGALYAILGLSLFPKRNLSQKDAWGYSGSEIHCVSFGEEVFRLLASRQGWIDLRSMSYEHLITLVEPERPSQAGGPVTTELIT